MRKIAILAMILVLAAVSCSKKNIFVPPNNYTEDTNFAISSNNSGYIDTDDTNPEISGNNTNTHETPSFPFDFPNQFIHNQVENLQIDRDIGTKRRFTVNLDDNTYSIDFPKSFFVGGNNINNQGVCKWLVDQHNLQVGDRARFEYYVLNSGERIKYRINIHYRANNNWQWDTWVYYNITGK